ncbi:MAG TPA: VOC family protein [Nocardioides sp.]|uniref:VOC family protein n=1 Tax=Nocardioides sp. TaxID=35761 RepID=UPI002F42B968
MVSFIKSVTFDCAEPLTVAAFWAAALGSDVDEDSTPDKAWVEPAGWGGPSLWFQRVPEGKVAKNRQHFDLRAVGDIRAEVRRLTELGARPLRDPSTGSGPRDHGQIVMADPEGNEFCVE